VWQHRSSGPPPACDLMQPPDDGILPGSNGCLPEGVLSASAACQAPPCGASGMRREPGHDRVGCNPNDYGAGLDADAGRATHGMASRSFCLGCRSRPAARFSRWQRRSNVPKLLGRIRKWRRSRCASAFVAAAPNGKDGPKPEWRVSDARMPKAAIDSP